MPTFIVLLRGINVGGRNRLPMSDLRSICEEVGGSDVRTYIQSGNAVLRADAGAGELQTAIQGAIRSRLGLSIAVVARTAEEWRDIVDGNPFPEASDAEPNRVMVALSVSPPERGAAARLQERGRAGERVALVGETLWIHFPAGAGRSKLTPTVLDRLAGSPVTMRNWRTVLRLAELAAEVETGGG